ncbi:MAG: hypothetical protein EOO46_17190, partial [Flavobacterium sp.]
MKKLLLLVVVALLPVFGFGQADLVQWQGSSSSVNLNPSIIALNGVSSAVISTGNSPTVSGEAYEGFTFSNWSNSLTLVSNQYIQFRITATANYKIDLSQFIFKQKIDQGPKKYQVRYSKSTAFAGEQSILLNEVTSSTSWVTRTLSFPSGVTLNPGETLYVRLYAYDPENPYWNGHRFTLGYQSEGPKITGTVSVATPPVPVPTNDAATTLQNTAVTIPVLTNDSYDNTLTTTVAISQQSANGNAVVNGSNQVVFTPTTGYTGTTTFQYTVANTNGTSTPATVAVSVTTPIAPTAVADTFTAPMNGFVDLNVLQNDNLGSAASVTAINTTTPSHGTVSVNAGNTIRYTPTAGYIGSDSFTYRIQTIYGTSSYVQVSLTVQPQTPTSGPLCGEYYVGTGGHFTTLTQAVNYLNANGVSCAVTFLLTNTLYQNVDANANG